MSRNFFGGLFGGSSQTTEQDLQAPFVLNLTRDAFCKIKTELLYKKILHRCYSRSEGQKDEKKIMSLFDSTEKSGALMGLISLLAKAMTDKQQIGIVYASGIVKVASSEEKQQILSDYKQSAESSKGVLVDFTKYCLTDLVGAYMSMIFDILSSMNTQVGLAKALQIKIDKLRATVSAAGKDEPIEQATSINESLKKGNSVLLDKNDQVDILTINSQSVKDAMELVNSLLASDLGVSLSFVNGALTSGMSATGEADVNQDEYGFQDFFNSIFKPTCDKLYKWDLNFISDDWRYSEAMLANLIIVENSAILSDEQKQVYANRAIPTSTK